eukprot:g5015.t1
MNVTRFAAQHTRELDALGAAILAEKSKKSEKGKAQKFQEFHFEEQKRHERRRATSFRSRRMPKRLQYATEAARKTGKDFHERCRKHRRRGDRNLKIGKRCLETHVWHAKRFHIRDAWGCAVPQRAHSVPDPRRVVSRGGAIMWDTSLCQTFRICGQFDSVTSFLGQVLAKGWYGMDVVNGHSRANIIFAGGGFPGELLFLPISGQCVALLRVHPSCGKEALSMLRKAEKRCECTVSDVSASMFSLAITGRGSKAALARCLSGANEACSSALQSLLSVPHLFPGMAMPLLLSADRESEIIDREANQEQVALLMTNFRQQVCTLVEKGRIGWHLRVWMSDRAPQFSLDGVPGILVQLPASSHGDLRDDGGWELFLPAFSFGGELWKRLHCEGQVVALGAAERRAYNVGLRRPTFPYDYVGSSSGRIEWEQYVAQECAHDRSRIKRHRLSVPFPSVSAYATIMESPDIKHVFVVASRRGRPTTGAFLYADDDLMIGFVTSSASYAGGAGSVGVALQEYAGRVRFRNPRSCTFHDAFLIHI